MSPRLDSTSIEQTERRTFHFVSFI